ncbi:SRPBCC family protein [Roseomonas sp. JC162]|uniref:SRPBCC family protein n=1 Tax=Neoroseomonas marina TaxID=1232220 RepID=A0A848EIL4_9PROT|nr:SRPBCC family protein [Neoroseomonas marina]NMJ43247.1 SRPBCC family protein [Neoroseomonas marina]
MPTRESRTLSTRIERPAAEVYAFASCPENLPRWAAGLGGAVTPDGADWRVETPQGALRLRFAAPNAYGVLDHAVMLPDGSVVEVPMRVVPNGDGAEVLFTLFRQPGMTEADFARDAGLVAADLATLKRLLEG